MTDSDAAGESGNESAEPNDPQTGDEVEYVSVHELRPEGYDGTCLRPLGLCDLGGCCDTCWYSPANPRFKNE